MSPQIKTTAVVIPVLLMFVITSAISVLVFHNHHNWKEFVGSVGLVACVAMYGSPLVVVVSTQLYILNRQTIRSIIYDLYVVCNYI
ncbi:hypothetical protein Dsin_017757 [Dipteronia sinensis]|uniref:Uncharacterized protein n=1 Tax=Dipteronia sinensis TaxID=43782 RepID=A0AAE0E6R2_9ROSI|nr:hypothetical protein Dsin_017757 [Dipteronia sinensis]